MYFKPRIFISSTLSDKLEIRKKIGKIFKEAGAEVALYEKNLTPSIEKSTYRNDILKTDFVIFIIDDKYGNSTENGISGTEEEFNIIASYNKPCHVYLKEIEKTDAAKRFEDDIKSKGISYYYYKDEKELEKKLKSTCFTIARDIVFANIGNYQINPIVVKNLAIHHDIKLGKSFCLTMDKAIEIDSKTQFSFIDSNLMIATLSGMADAILKETQSSFIDLKCEDLLRNVCSLICEFTYKMSIQSFAGPNFTFEFFGQTIYLCNNQWIPGIDLDWYKSKLQDIMDAYVTYKNYLAQKSLEKELSKW